MASGHANRTQAEHMAAPTQACDVRKVLANPEPSSGDARRIGQCPLSGVKRTCAVVWLRSGGLLEMRCTSRFLIASKQAASVHTSRQNLTAGFAKECGHP